MRSLSAAALTYVTTQEGVEPLNLVEVRWTNAYIRYYADRTIPEFGIEGKILELSSLENVVNVSGSSNSQSVSIKLDDDDLVLKHVYNYNDIHKRQVKIYQWFAGLHFNDKFLIFEGEISSPIVWRESDRTLSFDVISKIEDKEIGYSAEEGTYASIPDDLIGQPWPLPFGTVRKVPCLRLDNVPAGATLDSNIVEDFSIDLQITELSRKVAELGGLAIYAFNSAILMYYNSHFDANGSYQLERQDDQFEQMGDQLTEQGNDYLAQQWEARQDMMNLMAEKSRQGELKKDSIRVNGGDCFPQNQPLEATISGVKHTGTMAGSNFQIDSTTHPQAPTENPSGNITTIGLSNTIAVGGHPVIQKADFVWLPAGGVVKIQSNMPIRYIVAMLPVTVLNVWARKNYGDTRIMTQVPNNFYTVGLVNYGAVVATHVTLTRPLSHQEEGWDDDIFVDMVSPVGPNTVDILIWLIVTYTNGLGIDAASFNHVKARLAGFPSHFCLFDRQNIVTALQEIAYQARCAIWMKNDIFYLRFLPDQPSAVDSITLSDIILETLEVSSTSTEDIVTKLVASYKENYDQDKDYKFILRNNVPKYGTQEEETNWYIYTDARAVDIAATFWLIRKSNTWKLLRFRTPLHKMRLETFDPVLINFHKNWALNGSVVGIVQSVQLDTDQLQLEFEIWIPVRLGEMTKFQFAWPIDSEVLVYPRELQYAGSGGPGQQTGGELLPANNLCNRRITFEKSPKRQRVHNGHQNPGIGTYLTQTQGTAIIQPSIGNSDAMIYPGSDYQYRQYRTDPMNANNTLKGGIVPGKILEGEGPGYKIETYPEGPEGKTVETSAKNMDTKGDKLDVGTWVLVITLVYNDGEGGGPSITNGPQGSAGPPPPNKAVKVFIPSAGRPGVFAGKVISGSGSTYTMAIYKKGLGNEAETVEGVKQLQIAGPDAVPVDTWALVGEVKNEQGLPGHFMQVPVWLE